MQAYIEKFRNLSYLEQELEQHNRAEQDKFEVRQRRVGCLTVGCLHVAFSFVGWDHVVEVIPPSISFNPFPLPPFVLCKQLPSLPLSSSFAFL